MGSVSQARAGPRQSSSTRPWLTYGSFFLTERMKEHMSTTGDLHALLALRRGFRCV